MRNKQNRRPEGGRTSRKLKRERERTEELDRETDREWNGKKKRFRPHRRASTRVLQRRRLSSCFCDERVTYEAGEERLLIG